MDLISPSFIYGIFKDLIRVLPRALSRWKFVRFFGSGVKNREEVFLVLDSYSDSRPRAGNRYIKKFQGRRADQSLVGGDKIYGTFSPETTNFITALFLENLNYQIKTVTDEVLDKKFDATLICYGSSDSNIKTLDIEKETGKNFYRFDFGSTGQRVFKINNREFGFEQNPSRDKAVLLKTKNPYNPDHSYIICAGLSEWGSLGAIYYLARNWKNLYKRFKRENFCLIFEVDYGQYETARIVYSNPSFQ